MFVTSLRTQASFQAIAMLVAVSLLMWAVGVQFVATRAEAGNVVDFTALISDSGASAASDYTITFEVPNGILAGGEFSLEFEAGEFTLSNITVSDIDIEVNTVDQTIDTTNGAAQWGVSSSTNALIFHAPSGSPIASSSDIAIYIGRVGPNANPNANQIVNPIATATDGYTIDVTGTSNVGTPIADSGQTRVVIVDKVVVTAEVPTVFNFTVSGTPAGFALPDVPTTTATATTPTSLPFEVLTQNVSKTLAQQLNVETNADNGFIVTVEQSQEFSSLTGAIIDSFADGGYDDIPGNWVDPSEDISDDTTWGHWGMTSDDDDYNSGTNNQWIAVSSTPRVIFQHASSADFTTNDIGSTSVMYQVQVSPLQEAANDYTTTLTYIATPTF